ncbi:MAG: DNA-processing protein DprA [Bacteroidales bacterium]
MAHPDDPLLKYKIGMDLIPGIGSVLAKKIIEFTGSPEEAFRSRESLLRTIPGIGKTLAGNIASQQILSRAEKEIEFISRYQIRILYYLDDDYPERLKHCADSPVIMYIKGNADLNHPKILSIVGTRNATSYGLDFCRNLLEELTIKGYDPLIVSGLAYGIDICAHKTALDNKLQTIACLAHGLSTIYPPAHRNIAEKISKQGALVTDFTSSTLPEKGNFIKRNRIIAGLADATIVIESSNKGGALITADLANSYNRDVFALPGRVSDRRSQGCNNLIKINKAALIEEARDIEYILGWTPSEKKMEKNNPEIPEEMNDEEKVIIKLLLDGNSEMSADKISADTGFGAGKTSYLLLNLEFAGHITSLPGKFYRLSSKYCSPGNPI